MATTTDDINAAASKRADGRDRWITSGRDADVWDRHASDDHKLCLPVQGLLVRLDENGSPDGCRRA